MMEKTLFGKFFFLNLDFMKNFFPILEHVYIFLFSFLLFFGKTHTLNPLNFPDQGYLSLHHLHLPYSAFLPLNPRLPLPPTTQ